MARVDGELGEARELIRSVGLFDLHIGRRGRDAARIAKALSGNALRTLEAVRG